MAGFWNDIARLGRDAWENVGDYYQIVVLGAARLPQHPLAPQQEKEGPRFGGVRSSADLFPSKGIDGEIPPPEPAGPLPPDMSPYDPLAGLKALRIERGDNASEPALLPGREPHRGMDFDR